MFYFLNYTIEYFLDFQGILIGRFGTGKDSHPTFDIKPLIIAEISAEKISANLR